MEGYLRAQSERYITQYIDDNQAQFYLAYWYDNLPREESLDIAKKAYLQRRQRAVQSGNISLLKDYLDCERDFMLDSDDWTDFIKEKLL